MYNTFPAWTCRLLLYGLALFSIEGFAADKPSMENRALQTVPDGNLYVPAKVATGSPVLVICESPGRSQQLLKMMVPELEHFGVIALAPILPKKGRRVDASKGMPAVDGLLKQLMTGEKIQAGKLYAFSFSASGMLGYQMALANASRFSGLIAAATFQPSPPNVTNAMLQKGKALPVLLVHGEKDQMFGPERGKKALGLLLKAGLKATMKVARGAAHMDVVQKNAGDFLEWVVGSRKNSLETQANSDALKKASGCTVLWEQTSADASLFPALSLPGSKDERILCAHQDGYVLVDARDGTLKGSHPWPSALAQQLAHARRGVVRGRHWIQPMRSKKGGSDPDLLVCLDLNKNALIWKQANPAGIFSDLGASRSPINGASDVIGFGSHDTFYHLLKVADGKELWKAKTGVSCATTGCIEKEKVFFGGTSGVFAYSRDGGEQAWKSDQRLGFGSDALALNQSGAALFVCAGPSILCLSTADGSQRGTFSCPQNITGKPRAFGEKVYVPAGRTIFAVDSNGQKVWTANLPAPAGSSVVNKKTTLGLMLNDGRLAVLDKATGALMALSNTGYKPDREPLATKVGWVVQGANEKRKMKGKLVCLKTGGSI